MARLRAEAPSLVRVEGAEELAAIAEGVAPLHGTAFVIPYDEDAEPNDVVGGHRQTSTVVLVVAVVIRGHGIGAGGTRVSQVEAYRQALITALAGWQWQAESIPLEFVGGRTQPAKNGVLWYVTTWRTTRIIRRTP